MGRKHGLLWLIAGLECALTVAVGGAKAITPGESRALTPAAWQVKELPRLQGARRAQCAPLAQGAARPCCGAEERGGGACGLRHAMLLRGGNRDSLAGDLDAAAGEPVLLEEAIAGAVDADDLAEASGGVVTEADGEVRHLGEGEEKEAGTNGSGDGMDGGPGDEDGERAAAGVAQSSGEGMEGQEERDGREGGNQTRQDPMLLCWECGQEPTLECAMCGRALYCGIGCQEAQWERHRDACRSLRPLDRANGA